MKNVARADEKLVVLGIDFYYFLAIKFYFLAKYQKRVKKHQHLFRGVGSVV